MVEKWLKRGYSLYEIGLIWNGGEPVEKKGVNKYGQEYDTRLYGLRLLGSYSKLYAKKPAE